MLQGPRGQTGSGPPAVDCLGGGRGGSGRLALVGFQWAGACPFCAAVSLTFCEEISGADVAVIAKLVTPADPAGSVADVGKAKFEVTDRMKGDKTVAPGKKLEVHLLRRQPGGKLVLDHRQRRLERGELDHADSDHAPRPAIICCTR